uniref:SXP/RAL-2 family protein Ani s 5-like cation-binding domain-containing protein n=1 Tax=Strongyloides stercoralis TaxID=6248 RepID=A0A0K0EP59_STRER
MNLLFFIFNILFSLTIIHFSQQYEINSDFNSINKKNLLKLDELRDVFVRSTNKNLKVLKYSKKKNNSIKKKHKISKKDKLLLKKLTRILSNLEKKGYKYKLEIVYSKLKKKGKKTKSLKSNKNKYSEEGVRLYDAGMDASMQQSPSGNIQSDFSGGNMNMQGMSAGMQGGMPGDMQGMQGNMQGMQGGMGGMNGGMGGMQGNMYQQQQQPSGLTKALSNPFVMQAASMGIGMGGNMMMQNRMQKNMQKQQLKQMAMQQGHNPYHYRMQKKQWKYQYLQDKKEFNRNNRRRWFKRGHNHYEQQSTLPRRRFFGGMFGRRG